MWMHLEGELGSVKLKANVSQVTDLDDFREILRSKFEELKDIKNQRIIFFDYNNATFSQILAYKI
ncbi:8326_t:CDS:1, partial [Gigaspora rosea]